MSLSSVSYDWLVAETEAWPLGSLAAYDLGTVFLSDRACGVPGSETEVLATRLEEWLRPRARGTTLEVLRQIREDAWLTSAHKRVTLASYAIRLAERYLAPEGDRVRLRSHHALSLSERAGRWRWLTYLLPQDLLIAALAAKNGTEPRGEPVHLTTPHLDRILNEKKVAETHLHVGAAVPFPLLWTMLLATLPENPPSEKGLEREGPPPFGSGRAFLGKLLASAIARLVMAAFLSHREGREHTRGFEDFCCSLEGGLSRITSRLAWDCPSERGEYGEVTEARREILAVLAHLGWSKKPPDVVAWMALYRKLMGPARLHRSAADLEIASIDPLWTGNAGTVCRALPESRFAARAIGYLVTEAKDDHLFERTFWQYQRVRCATFRYLVEEPGTGGLDWFSRHYQRIGELRKGLDNSLYRLALESDSIDLQLGALEARRAPPSTWPEVYGEIRKLAEQAATFGKGQQSPEIPEVGLILHFIKERADRSRNRLHADPSPHGVLGCRFGRWFRSRLRQTFAIECALKRDPEILLLLRGIDVANFELAVPTWVCLPLFERLRHASIRAAQRLAQRLPEWQATPLRVTCHLGEDFVRLSQGLRRIHEPVEFGLLGIGSRIGHAVALGVDPEAWAASFTLLPQTAEERLDDLLWELDRYGSGDIPSSATGRSDFVLHEIVQLGRKVYGQSGSRPEDLLQARRLLHTPRWLGALDYPYVQRPDRSLGPSAAPNLAWRYLTDPSVFERGQEKLEVRADESEVAFLRVAQQWLRREVGQLEITIESNPSSNLLIGELHSFDNHPAFRLLPLSSNNTPEECPVMLSVNVDDPITFASKLADEYAHIYFALTRRGVGSQTALGWLCQVRDHGWRSRFTLSASRSPENLGRFRANSSRPS